MVRVRFRFRARARVRVAPVADDYANFSRTAETVVSGGGMQPSGDSNQQRARP